MHGGVLLLEVVVLQVLVLQEVIQGVEGSSWTVMMRPGIPFWMTCGRGNGQVQGVPQVEVEGGLQQGEGGVLQRVLQGRLR